MLACLTGSPFREPKARLAGVARSRQIRQAGKPVGAMRGDVVAREQELVPAALQERPYEKLLVIAAPRPFGGIAFRKEDVVHMKEDARRQPGQDVEEEAVDVGAGHGDVARIDEEDVARFEAGQDRWIDLREELRHMRHPELL